MKKTNDPIELVTVAEAAKMLGVCLQTVYKRIGSGALEEVFTRSERQKGKWRILTLASVERLKAEQDAERGGR